MITKLQYVEFLIRTVANYTDSYMSEHLEPVSHDAVTDFLPSAWLMSRHLGNSCRVSLPTVPTPASLRMTVSRTNGIPALLNWYIDNTVVLNTD